jgi:hypothetical protein
MPLNLAEEEFGNSEELEHPLLETINTGLVKTQPPEKI